MFEKIERAMDKAPPDDDIQRKLEASAPMAEYRKKIALSAVGIGLALASLGGFYVFAKNRPPPKIMLASMPASGEQAGQWRVDELSPMMLPNQSHSTIQGWSLEVVQKVYTFDFLHFNEQIGGSKEYFTSDGWAVFAKVFKNSELLKTVQTNKLSVTVTPTAEPLITGSAKDGGKDYAWKVIVPVIVSFSGDTPTQSQEMNMNLTIVRVPTAENPRGLGVLQLFARPAR